MAAPAGGPAGDDGAIVTPCFAFGFTPTAHGSCLHHLEGSTLLYTAGTHLALVGAEGGGGPAFVPGRHGARRVRVLAVVASKRYAAAAEAACDEAGGAEEVSVFSLPAGRHERGLELRPHTRASSVAALSFSGDGKLLLVAAGEPDWALLLWRWHGGGKVALVVLPELEVLCAALSPWDEAGLAVAAAHAVRTYRLDLAPPCPAAKPVHHALPEHGGGAVVTCLAHLVCGALAVGSSGGHVWVFGPAAGGPLCALDINGAAARGGGGGGAANGVQALVHRGRGFLAAGSACDVFLFDPPPAAKRAGGGAEGYTLSRVFSFASAVGAPLSPPDARVLGLSVSATDDQLALATGGGQLLLLDVTAATAALEEAAADGGAGRAGAQQPDPADGGWQVVCGGGFAAARIVGLDACQHLPLLLVVSDDKWARLWDWARRTRVAARRLGGDAPLCCALHPSGAMAAIGSGDALRVFHVLHRELAPLAELPVAKCGVACYSHGGALLAAAGRSNAIVLYPAYYGAGAGANGHDPSAAAGAAAHYAQGSTSGGGARGGDGPAALRPLAVLKAHVSTVTGLAFSGDDRRLVSCGAGGALYFWDVPSCARLGELEFVDKRSIYHALAHHDRVPAGAAVARTTDGRLQHIQGGQLMYELSGLGSNDSSPVALTAAGRVVLAATARGGVLSVPWPRDAEAAGEAQRDARRSAAADAAAPPCPAALAAPGAREFGLHAGPVTHLKVLHAAGVIFTASADGLVLMSRVSLVLDGLLCEPPPLALPPSAMAAGSTAAAAAAAAAAGAAAADGGGAAAALAAALGAAGGHAPVGGVPGLPPAVVAVDAGLLQVLHEQLRASAGQVAAAQKEAQWQVLRETQALRASLSASEQRAAALAGEAESLRAALARSAADADAAQQQVRCAARGAARAARRGAAGCAASPALAAPQLFAELESLHVAAAEQLEGLYEARLALEAERYARLAAAKDDLELGLKEEMRRRAEAAAADLAHARAAHAEQLAAETARAEGAAAAAAEAAAVWEEVLVQTEEDLEQQAERDGGRLAAAQHDAGEVQIRLRAELSILQRSNARLQAEKAADAAAAAALGAQIAALRQQVAAAGADADKLRRELEERDSAIRAGEGAAEALRRRIKELETHAFVLGHKARRRTAAAAGSSGRWRWRRWCAHASTPPRAAHVFWQAEVAAAELQPREEALRALQSTVDGQVRARARRGRAAPSRHPTLTPLARLAVLAWRQERELLAGRSSLLATQRAVEEKAAAASAAKRELWAAKATLARQAGLLEAATHDVYHVLQQPDERTRDGRSRRTVALEALAAKYCAGRGGGPRSSVEVEGELRAIIVAAERKAALMEAQLKQACRGRPGARRGHGPEPRTPAPAAAARPRPRPAAGAYAHAQAQAAKAHAGRRLMSDNAALLGDLAELQRGNRHLARSLAAAADQLATCGARLRGLGDAAGGGRAEPQPEGAARSERSRGGSAAGALLPASAGRVLAAALAEQQAQFQELQSLLAATGGIVAAQAAQLARLHGAAGSEAPPGAGPRSVEACGEGRSRRDAELEGVTGAADGAPSLPGFARGLLGASELSDGGGAAAVHAAPGLRAPQQHGGAAWLLAAGAPRLLRSTSPPPGPAAGGGPHAPGRGGGRPASAGRARPASASPGGAPERRLRGGQLLLSASLAEGGLAATSRSPPAGPKRRPGTAGGW
ncbi:CFAP57 [Scenedesmus sp. PABB004]|nr:CFAP57 [Scenedesmus sp. PABB004]